MLYDQAQLAVAYSYAYQSTKDKKYAAIVEDILTYVNRYVRKHCNLVLHSQNCLFFSP